MSHSMNTSNYRLPIFADSDTPTWLGDWNQGMEEVDEALSAMRSNVTDSGNKVANLSVRVENAETKVNGLDGRISANAEGVATAKEAAETASAAATLAKSTADSALTQTAANAKSIAEVKATADSAIEKGEANAASVSDAAQTANNALSLAKTNEQDISLAETRITELEKLPVQVQTNKSDIARVSNKFPVHSADIANAAVTADKIDTTAANAILEGLTFRYFDSHESNADNEGMRVPANVQLAGFYIPELYILVITRFASEGNADLGNNENPKVFLPNYVPTVTKKVYGSGFSWIKWDSSNEFIGWSGVTLTVGNRGIAPNTSNKVQKGDLCGSAVFYLRPFTAGGKAQSASYADMAAANGMVR